MVQYNLEHLTQDDSQAVVGPIQDDEALVLFSIIRGKRISTVLEIGGLNGYSAQNFIEAVSVIPDSYVFTCDINEVPKLSDNHITIKKNVLHLTNEDLLGKKIELLFFDCHSMFQMNAFRYLREKGLITDETVICLHDTNLHYDPYCPKIGGYSKTNQAWIHQPVERKITNLLKKEGYDIFLVHTTRDKHSKEFPMRHGLALCQKFVELVD